MRSVSPLRWVAASVFILSTTLNYLDRQLLAALAPMILHDLHFDQTGYGWLLSVFSIFYAASAIFVGWFIDRVGINRSMTAAVAWWSAAAMSVGWANGWSGLAASRAALAIGESAGVPAVGKLNGVYLKPSERALGAALNQVGISAGLALAPAWIGVAYQFGWRAPFMLAGALGFLWIPVWLIVSRFVRPPEPIESREPMNTRPKLSLLFHPDLLWLVTANFLWMGAYSLWSSWTTIYLVNVFGLTLKQTAAYVWIPPLVSNAGGFFGGWLSFRAMRRGAAALHARRRAVLVSAVGMLSTLVLPIAGDARWATAIISCSFFFSLAGSVNIYAMPIDLFGAERSGLAISALVFAFGVLQTIISPVIGYLSQHRLYTEVVWLVTVPPLLACLALRFLSRMKPQDN